MFSRTRHVVWLWCACVSTCTFNETHNCGSHLSLRKIFFIFLHFHSSVLRFIECKIMCTLSIFLSCSASGDDQRLSVKLNSRSTSVPCNLHKSNGILFRLGLFLYSQHERCVHDAHFPHSRKWTRLRFVPALSRSVRRWQNENYDNDVPILMIIGGNVQLISRMNENGRK